MYHTMVNLDLKLWNVSDGNNALIWGLGKDIGTVIENSAWAVGNIFSPTAGNIFQNTSQLTRNPWKTLTTGSSWAKFFKTFPAAGADLITKTASLPFRTLEWALTYGVANNFERAVSTVKGVSTDTVRNWFHNGGNANKFMNGMGHLVWGTGDLVWSAIKLIPFTAEWLAKQPNKFIWNPAMRETEWWVTSQRLWDVDFWTPKALENKDYSSIAANNNSSTAQTA